MMIQGLTQIITYNKLFYYTYQKHSWKKHFQVLYNI